MIHGKNLLCPFCNAVVTRIPFSSLEPEVGHRVLVLEECGMNAYTVASILWNIEHRFNLTPQTKAHLPIKSLFDVIIGTGMSGVIALNIHEDIPLLDIKQSMLDLATTELYRANALTRSWCDVFNTPLFDSKVVRNHVSKGLQHKPLRRNPGYPRVCVTAYDTAHDKTVLIGNFPNGSMMKRGVTGSTFAPALRLGADQAAVATSAYPTWVQSFRPDSCDSNFYAGAVGPDGACPVKYALEIIQMESRPDLLSRLIDSIICIGCGSDGVKDGDNRKHLTDEYPPKTVFQALLDNSYSSKYSWDDVVTESFQQRVNTIRFSPKLSPVCATDPYKSSKINTDITVTEAEIFARDMEEGDSRTPSFGIQQIYNTIYAGLWYIKEDMQFIHDKSCTLTLKLRDLRIDAAHEKVPKDFAGEFVIEIPSADDFKASFGAADAIQSRTVELPASVMQNVGPLTVYVYWRWPYQAPGNVPVQTNQVFIAGSPFTREVVSSIPAPQAPGLGDDPYF